MLHDLLQRVGSRDSISWVTVAFVYPSSLLFSLLGSGVELYGDAPRLLILATITTSTVMLGCLGIARLLIFGMKKQVEPRPALVLAAFTAALCVRAGLFDILLLELGLSDASWFWYRLFASIPSTGTGLIFVAIIVSLARDYNRALERLDRSQRSFAELERVHHTFVENERQRVIALARVSLDERLRDLDSEASPEALRRVRTAIEDVVRPLSHLLNEPAAHDVLPPEAATVPVSWRAVFGGLFTRRSILPFWYTVWFVFAGLLYAPVLWGPEIGLPYVALLACITYPSCVIADLCWKRFFAHRGWVARAIAFSVISLAVGALFGVSSAALAPTLGAGIVGHTLGMMAAALLAGWAFATLLSLQYNVRMLEVRIHDAEESLHRERIRLNATLRSEMRALARFLHGPVQDALSVAAFRLRAALEEGVASPALLAELKSSIEQTIARMPAAELEASEAEEVLGQLTALWDGVADIGWSLSDRATEQLASSTITRSSFNELVREACSNAIRHGEASKVSIFADVQNEELVLTVRNQGVPIHEGAKTGFGTKLVDELAFSWRRQPTNNGTLLVMHLPLVD